MFKHVTDANAGQWTAVVDAKRARAAMSEREAAWRAVLGGAPKKVGGAQRGVRVFRARADDGMLVVGTMGLSVGAWFGEAKGTGYGVELATRVADEESVPWALRATKGLLTRVLEDPPSAYGADLARTGWLFSDIARDEAGKTWCAVVEAPLVPLPKTITPKIPVRGFTVTSPVQANAAARIASATRKLTDRQCVRVPRAKPGRSARKPVAERVPLLVPTASDEGGITEVRFLMLTNWEGRSAKQWRIAVHDKTLMIGFGRLTAFGRGRRVNKRFDSVEAAITAAEKAIRTKLAEGYVVERR